MRTVRWCGLLALLLSAAAAAQEVTPSVSGWAQFYVQLAEGEDALPVGIVALNHGPWHFEARYNYEDIQTGSLWVGWNLSTGSAVELEFTPMAALVIGTVDGFAPGFEATVSWKRFTFYDESELVVPFDAEPAYFVSWSSATWRFADLLQPGVTAQRFRVHAGEREVDWGFALVSEFGSLGTGLYAFDPFGASPFWQLAATWSF